MKKFYFLLFLICLSANINAFAEDPTLKDIQKLEKVRIKRLRKQGCIDRKASLHFVYVYNVLFNVKVLYDSTSRQQALMNVRFITERGSKFPSGGIIITNQNNELVGMG